MISRSWADASELESGSTVDRSGTMEPLDDYDDPISTAEVIEMR